MAVSYAFDDRTAPTQTRTQSSSLAAATPAPQAEVAYAYYEKDTDGDGLHDWEELLHNTDPTLGDTDGDGVPDREEVLAGSDAADRDDIPRTLDGAAVTDGNVSDDQPLTATDAVARQLFGTYMLTLQEGKDLSPREQEQLAKNALAEVVPALTPPTYELSEVRVVAANETTRTQYTNDVAGAILRMLTEVTSEYQLLYEMPRNNKEETAAELQRTVEYYRAQTTPLQSIAVPSDAVQLHVNLMKALLGYIHHLGGIAGFTTDPVLAATSLQIWEQDIMLLQMAFADFATYAQEHNPESIQNIAFAPST
jgi:hypothetical protein